MDDSKKTENNKIKEIFETMDYASAHHEVNKATDWLKLKGNRLFAYVHKKEEEPTGQVLALRNANNLDQPLCDIYSPEPKTTNAILEKISETKNVWSQLPPLKQTELIYKFGDNIKKHGEVMVELEVIARGILPKDTRNTSLQLLTDYLHYYSSFTFKCSSNKSDSKSPGIAVAIVSDDNPIFVLGLMLGPALAFGYQVILQTGPTISLVAAYLIDLSVHIGIPEGTIRLIPGDVDLNVFFTHPAVSLISVFDDLRKEEYVVVNQFSKNVLHFHSSGAPVIVFDDSDLDAACEAVANAAWGCKGMLPWSVRNVFIQENIFENVVQKMKQHVQLLKVGTGDKKNVDISYPTDLNLDKLTKIIGRAKSEGVELYQPQPNGVIPTLIIGGHLFNNNVIKEDALKVPILLLTAFRTINEAVTLANNTRQGLAASVWTESTSLVNEIVGKLQVSNIWINSHGKFIPDVAVSPHKNSGNAYFGGPEGFHEYGLLKPLNVEALPQIKGGEAMEKVISEATKAQNGWSVTTRFERVKYLLLATQTIETVKKTLNVPTTWLDEWIQLIIDACNLRVSGSVTTHQAFNVMTMHQPFGVIAIETLEDISCHNKRLIIAGLLQGNCVIVLNDANSAMDFYDILSKLLPKGVFNVIVYGQDASKVAALHQELILYFGERSNSVFRTLPLKGSRKFKISNDNWEEALQKTRLAKNVWMNVGQSFM